MSVVLNFLSLYLIPLVVFLVPLYAILKKVPIYTTFTDGAKEGFSTAIMIIPYLTAMLCAIGMFRASGAMDWLVSLLDPITSIVGLPGVFIEQASDNTIRPQTAMKHFKALCSQVTINWWNPKLTGKALDDLQVLTRQTSISTYACNMNPEAAFTLHRYLTKLEIIR